MALSEQQIRNLWIAQGGAPKYADVMAKIAIRESGGRPKINNRGTNRNGTVDWGLFQVNDVWRRDPVVGKLFKSGAILTPQGATQAAIHILKVQGPKAWATYNPATDAKYIGRLSGGGGTVSRGSTPGASTTTTFPGVDHGPDRRAMIAQFIQSGGADNPAAVQSLAMNLPGVLKDTPSRTVTKTTPGVPATTYGGSKHGSAGSFPSTGGLVAPKAAWNPQGKSMAGWLAQALQWAHQHGWRGYVISGYRTAAEQQAAASNYGLQHYPHGVQASNHRTGNAVDVADPAQLAQVLKGYSGKRPIWGGPVMGDTPHFSNNGH